MLLQCNEDDRRDELVMQKQLAHEPTKYHTKPITSIYSVAAEIGLICSGRTCTSAVIYLLYSCFLINFAELLQKQYCRTSTCTGAVCLGLLEKIIFPFRCSHQKQWIQFIRSRPLIKREGGRDWQCDKDMDRFCRVNLSFPHVRMSRELHHHKTEFNTF